MVRFPNENLTVIGSDSGRERSLLLSRRHLLGGFLAAASVVSRRGLAATLCENESGSSALVAGKLAVDADFPGGNIIVEGLDGDTIFLRQDLRDTEGW